MPGVTVTTSALTGSSTPLRAPDGQVFMVGLAERGVTDAPIKLNGMADYDDLLGSRVSYGVLFDQLSTFFSEGGEQAYVARVVGPAATKGTHSFNDRAGTPVPTLKVDAASEGAWSANVTVEVQDGALADTFRLVVRLNGDVVADENNIDSPASAVTRFATSPYVRLTNLGSATAAPTNNPAVIGATALSAGADDRASVVADDHVAALDLFYPDLGDGAVCIPGQGSAVHDGLVTHAEANRRVALLSGALSDDTTGELATLAAGVDSSYAGLFGPWVNISDGSGGYRQISPEGFVAAKRAVAHSTTGAWAAPAGEFGKSKTLVGLAATFDRVAGDSLNASRVSVLRVVQGSIRLYGWRSLSSDEVNFHFLSARDLLNRLTVLGEQELEQFVFKPIDSKGHLLSAINAAVVGIAQPIAAAGGIYAGVDPITGAQTDPGYSVDTGAAVNSAASLAQNQVKARLGVRPAPTGELVFLDIVQVPVTSGLS